MALQTDGSSCSVLALMAVILSVPLSGVMLKYAGKYCEYGEYCKAGDATCRSCSTDDASIM